MGILEEEYMKIKYYPDADALDVRISDEKPDYGGRSRGRDDITLHAG